MNYHPCLRTHTHTITHTHRLVLSLALALSLSLSLPLSFSLSLSLSLTHIQVLDHARQLETQNQGLTRTVEELHTRVADLETALAASNAETVAAALRAVGATSLGTADSGTGGRVGKKRMSKMVASPRGGAGPPPPPVIGGGPPPPPAIGGGPPPPPMMGGGPGGPPPPPPGPPGPPGAPPRLGGGRGGGGVGLLPAGVALPAKVNPAVPLRALFWNKLPNNKLMGTVWVDWHVAESKGGGEGGGEGVAFDLRKLEASFAKKVSGQESKARTPAGANEGAGAGGKPRKAVSLLDGKRQQNGGITMARLRLDGAALRAALVAVNLEVLTVDKVKAVGQLLPTAEEAHTLAEHDASNPATVPPLDALMLTLSEFPRLKPRLDAMTFRHNFAEKCDEISASIGSLGKAVDAVRGSTAIKTVLMTVLHVGNHMNGGTNRGQCIGFKVRLYTLSDSPRGLAVKHAS